eukprot:TRINITY_DN34785_c0_g1_i1.p1 TRINITY_DN34785_c0_g1~~TRINITY_DN34785_c0_g1_i1.p1  ORF type:complete len:258 (+),score=30.61 TRINITY_DN34785_c0_g1_i1:52-825(+)
MICTIDMRPAFAEMLGTFVFVFSGTMAAVFSNRLAASLTFAGATAVMTYTVGPVSGCHLNPAVSLAFAALGKLPWSAFFTYAIAQFLGAFAASAWLLLVATSSSDYSYGCAECVRTGLGANDSGPLKDWGAFVVEFTLTAMFVLVVLCSSSPLANRTTAGLCIGISLFVAYAAGPVPPSMNPARSLAPAVLDGLQRSKDDLWAFILGPLAGSLGGVLLFRTLGDADVLSETSADVPPFLEDAERRSYPTSKTYQTVA